MLCLIFTSIIVLCSSTTFIPPIGSYFQLKNLQSGRCLYSNADGRFNAFNCVYEYLDQIWQLEVEHSSNTNYYRIKNRHSGKCLYSNSDGRFSVSGCYTWDDQYWTFVPKPDNENYFHIKNLQSNECIYSNSDGRFGDYRCADYTDQYWTFVLEPYEIIEVDFDLNLGDIIAETPFLVGQGECDNTNGGSTDQTVSVTASETVSETSSFSNTAGFGIEIGTTFSTGVPFIAKGEISTTLSFSYEHTWGQETTNERSFGGTFPVTCAPGERIQVECLLFEGNLNVPYTITLQTIETQKEFYSYGIWSGTQGYEFDCDFTRLPPE